MSSADDAWTYEEDGPVARPYTVTGGRTRPRGERYFDLVDIVVRGAGQPDLMASSPEHAAILDLCRTPVSVAELAATIGLPLGVIRVLLDDLAYADLVDVRAAAPRGGVVTDTRILSKVLAGLRSL
jgi:hypothetical protein